MSSSVEDGYRFLREKSWDGGEEQVRQTIYLNRKVSIENMPKNHTRKNHDFHMSRYKRCVYCEAGCVMVENDEVNKEL